MLRGEGPDDLRELAVCVAGDLAEAAEVVPEGEGRARAERALAEGDALAMAERWIEAQEGDPAVWTDPGALPSAPFRIDVEAAGDGAVAAIDARGIGEAARYVGAGRLHADQSIDPVAGVELLVGVGDRVTEGQPVAVIHCRDEWVGERGRELAETCVAIAPEAPERTPIVIERGRGGA